MNNARTAFCLMWILPPIEFLTLWTILSRTSSVPVGTGVMLIGFVVMGLTVVWLLRMADPSTRQKRKIVPPIELHPEGLGGVRYLLGDDGEVVEVVEDEKRKRGGE
jgi:hypothetical protein